MKRRMLSTAATLAAAALLTGPAVKPAAAAATMGFNPLVDYTKPNFANSPNLRKFVDSLPGLGSGNANNLGQYIPVAVPDTSTYSGADYYELGLKQYQERLHSDLPAAGTPLRGYYQKNTGTAAGTDHSNHYLGPLIIAKRDRPVRIKFYNELLTGAAGNLPLPVDTTVMGAGLGPTGQMYTQNRANIHLHGGFVPWISDGTPHQWITPAGDPAPYKKGDSFQNVPDMVNGSVVNGTPVPCVGGSTCFTPTLGDGIGTYFYPNQQSARLMFYHDHSYGITRLNVYAGEAAGYLLTDQVEEDLISGTNVTGANPTGKSVLPDLGGVYHYGIPLIIQDRSFVNDASTPPHASFAATGATATPTTAATDPRWSAVVPATATAGGSLWFPHEYMPNEDIFDPSGFNVFGRWDYGPFLIPPMVVMNTTLPTPTIVPEAFMDTPVVNGTAYPYLTLPPAPVRFRILNACNDRMLNLQLYYADPAHPTEVKMVPASPNPAYPTWPVDGRPGGVPDPTTAGPSLIQIGNEAGFLVQPAVIPPQPVDFDYSRRSVTFGGVTSKSLLLPPAVRADVVADLSSVPPGSTLILYNDAPAPMPLFDTRYDYFTDGPDQTGIGGAPTVPIGFGPNTRTIMQIRVAGAPSAPFDLAALQATLPKAFAIAQDPPLVKASAYGPAYNATYADNYANSVDETLNISGSTHPVASVITTIPGLGYTTPPTVEFIGGGCSTPPAATATLNGVTGVTLVSGGSGYTSAPTVTISGGGGSGATAVATVSGGVITTISIVNPGSNYTTPPTISITGGGGTGGSALSAITLTSVGAINLTNPGAGCSKAPLVNLVGGGGMGAAASSMLVGDLVMVGKNLVEGMDMEYGRMNAQLGSTPNPLAPALGAGPVIGMARYIDPPTEMLSDGETQIWRISHIGVDSHAIHFHLFNVQVVNRVDWTNTVKPPYEEELGWKETIRTNPFEDIILAVRPVSMKLPFPVPNSNRLLDPTMPAGSTMNFQPVPPPLGVPAVAQTSNVMTNFGWEYVWHCHLLGHEENDMMRPMVLLAPTAAPPAPGSVTQSPAVQKTTVSWTHSSTPSNAPNGFTVQRRTNTGAYSTIATINNRDQRSYDDTTTSSATSYGYRVQAFNNFGTSSYTSTASNQTTPTWSNPTVSLTAPANGATLTGPASITLTASATGGGAATVSKVDFYKNGLLLGSATSSPYSMVWNNPPAGSYPLTAVVTNSNGAKTTSAPVSITVVQPSVAAMVTPVSGTTLSGASQSFTWNNSGASTYQVWVGSTAGASNLGFSPQTTGTSATINGLPTNGSTVYVRLWSLIGSTWSYNDYSYTTPNLGMVTPVNGATLSSSSQTFTWSNTGATMYQVWIGSTAGASNLGFSPQTTGTSATINGLPTDGSTLYVRLWAQSGGNWTYNDYTYHAVATAAMATPANGATLAGPSQTFTWNNTGASMYQLWVGTTPGSFDLGFSPQTTGTTASVAGFPANGSTVNVRLWSLLGTNWTFNDYSYVSGP